MAPCLISKEPLIKPRLLILGNARHGKDTVAELLRDRHGYTFVSSSYVCGEKAVRPALAERGIVYDSMADCYADRVNHRAFWYDTIAAYNTPADRLAREVLKQADIYVGMRSGREYRVARPLFDAVLWVDASGRGLPPEPRSSMDIDYDIFDMERIDNGGDLDQLTRNVDRIADYLGRSAKAVAA